MLRTAHTAQYGGNKRLQQHAKDDDQDKSQYIFHNHELISFSLCFGLYAPGMPVFSAFLKRSLTEEGKPETENTLSKRGRLSVSPETVWLDDSEGELSFAEKIQAIPGHVLRWSRKV